MKKSVLSCVEMVRTFKEARIYNDSIPQHDLEYLIHLMKQGEEVMKEDLREIGRGQFGTVFGYKEYAIKFARRQRYSWSKESEDAEILKHLQHLDFIPRLYATYGTEFMIVSRVRGTTVEKFLDARMSGGTPYINPRFNDAFKEMLKDIVQSGFIPHDMHSKNVMIDAKTGMPMLVDVGYFDACNERQKEQFSSRDAIDFTSVGAIRRAIGWVCDKTEPYISEDNMKEMEQQRKDQVDAIHNHAEIGEMLIEAKEQQEKPMIEFGLNGFKVGGKTAKHISWDKPVGEIVKRVESNRARMIGLGAQGMQDMIKDVDVDQLHLDAIKRGGNVGIDFGQLRVSGQEALKLYVAKNRYRHLNPDAGIIPPQPMHFEMIGAGGIPPKQVFFDLEAQLPSQKMPLVDDVSMPELIDGEIHNVEPVKSSYKPNNFDHSSTSYYSSSYTPYSLQYYEDWSASSSW
ncbi:serine/threonine protein kinase [Bacillus phage Kirov]|uniref:Serine/threonine protein kinase n=1 Tax=Bacillus phage Kirov TaxID=2783539 RepID=A0A7U3NKN7_9CAUD|nr:serine-threonine kinase [Bacillus phage Kirov]QOV08458.1 serine/threonine protein kinase [Bacillus phage Kirov]